MIMKLKIGDRVSARINKIQENGCYCTLLHLNQFGFMPNYLMPSFFDENGGISSMKRLFVVEAIIKTRMML